MKRIIIALLIGIIILTSIYGLAGRLDWIEMHIFLITFITVFIVWALYLKYKAPDLLEERMSAYKRSKKWDRTILRIYCFLLIVFIMVVSLDGGSYPSAKIPFWFKMIAYILIVLSYALSFWAAYVNKYLSSLVRIQKDRGHQVIEIGPYKYIRHPMYASIVVSYPLIALFLDSYYAMIPAFLIGVLFLVRTYLEDQTLQMELDGYLEYTKQVKYRLFPFVW